MISIVLPTYNRAKTICRAIDSILKQSYQEFELLIIDDGSTDNTEEVVRGYTDPRIQYVIQAHLGACAARNKGVELSKGNYIAFQDSDDEWLSDKLERQINYLVAKDADVVFHAFERMEYNEQNIEIVPDTSLQSKQINSYDLLPYNIMSTQTIMGKRSVFLDEKFSVIMPRYQDWELGFRLVEKYKVFYDNSVLAKVYVQNDSISHNLNSTVVGLDQMIHLISKFVFLQKKYLDEERKVVCKLQTDLDTMRNSLSWKITCPLRKLQQIFTKNKLK